MRPSSRGRVDERASRLALDRRFHDPVERAERGGRGVVAREQACKLGERSDRASRDDRAGDHAAQREFPFPRKISADDEHNHATHGLHIAGEVQRERRQQPRRQAFTRDKVDQTFPFALELRCGVEMLHVLDRRDRSRSHRVFRFGRGEAAPDVVTQGRLQRDPTTITIGQSDQGRQHHRNPPIQKMTARNISTNGRSMIEASVAEVKNSRSDSNSRRLFASVPTRLAAADRGADPSRVQRARTKRKVGWLAGEVDEVAAQNLQ